MKVNIKLICGLSSSGGCSSSGSFELILGTVMKGSPGKSAYQYATEGGYTRSEEEFGTLLAEAFTHKTIKTTDEVKI